MRLPVTILNGLMAMLFIYAAALQYNDDDIVRWMAIYLAAAACCIAAHIGKMKCWMPVTLIVICVAWAGIYAARGAWSIPFGEMFAEWEMKNQQVVEEREMFGLLIVAGWMLVLALEAGKKRASVQPR